MSDEYELHNPDFELIHTIETPADNKLERAIHHDLLPFHAKNEWFKWPDCEEVARRWMAFDRLSMDEAAELIARFVPNLATVGRVLPINAPPPKSKATERYVRKPFVPRLPEEMRKRLESKLTESVRLSRVVLEQADRGEIPADDGRIPHARDFVEKFGQLYKIG